MDKNTTDTKHKIGKVTYVISASQSEKATDSINKKIERLIMKDMREKAVDRAFAGN